MKKIIALLCCCASIVSMQKPFKSASATNLHPLEERRKKIEWTEVPLAGIIESPNGYELRSIYDTDTTLFYFELEDKKNRRVNKYSYALGDALKAWELNKTLSNIHVYGIGQLSPDVFVAVLLAQHRKPDDVFIHTRFNLKIKNAWWYIKGVKENQGRYIQCELLSNEQNMLRFNMRIKNKKKIVNSYSIYSETSHIESNDEQSKSLSESDNIGMHYVEKNKRKDAI